MKSLIVLGVVVFFLIVSGFHGLMWLLGGISESYKQLVNGESTNEEFRDFIGKLFLLFFVGFGFYQVFFFEMPGVLRAVVARFIN